MSKIGYTPDNAGSKINTAFTHYTAYNLLKDWSGHLQPNSLILCSPLDHEYNDHGSYALVATDSEGNAVRLTYNIVEGITSDRKD